MPPSNAARRPSRPPTPTGATGADRGRRTPPGPVACRPGIRPLSEHRLDDHVTQGTPAKVTRDEHIG
ncbi:hypothetical protein AB0M42_07625 [Streptomyces sp. NPDC051784]|uniref:hypothetical protein n=1 Tax=Streptomyces sp. NPDC051784 TaxID=3155805 RepID=UPI00343F4175